MPGKVDFIMDYNCKDLLTFYKDKGMSQNLLVTGIIRKSFVTAENFLFRYLNIILCNL